MTLLRRKALPLFVLALSGAMSLGVANADNGRVHNAVPTEVAQDRTATEMADARLERMRTSLNLTNAQVNALREPLVRYYTNRAELRTRLANAPTDEVRANLRQELRQLAMRLDERLKMELTPAQYANYKNAGTDRDDNYDDKHDGKHDGKHNGKGKKKHDNNGSGNNNGNDADGDDDDRKGNGNGGSKKAGHEGHDHD